LQHPAGESERHSYQTLTQQRGGLADLPPRTSQFTAEREVMKAMLESTSKVVEFNGIPARIWEGKTEKGIPFHAFIVRVGVGRGEDSTEFEAELKETRSPSVAMEAIPLRMIL
jgi:hypothetical protein